MTQTTLTTETLTDGRAEERKRRRDDGESKLTRERHMSEQTDQGGCHQRRARGSATASEQALCHMTQPDPLRSHAFDVSLDPHAHFSHEDERSARALRRVIRTRTLLSHDGERSARALDPHAH